MSKRLLRKLGLVIFILVPLLVGINGTAPAWEILEVLETVTGEDGSMWERVNQPGFGNQDNVGIVSLCPYQENLYAITRNDVTGFELWKTSGTGWTRVTVMGFTDNNNYFGWIKPGAFAEQYDTKYNLKQNIWGDMIEFNDSLYVTVSSGFQGRKKPWGWITEMLFLFNEFDKPLSTNCSLL